MPAFDGDRAAVRAQTVAHALAGLVRRIAAGCQPTLAGAGSGCRAAGTLR
jgi:hypothetical protein